MQPIFLRPYFRNKIWGRRKLNTFFHYQIPAGKVGEAWIISGYRNDASVAVNEPYEGQSLRQIYHAHPELFAYPHEKEFPLLVKYLDANDNLSIQVHPDDAYAHRVENDSGKTESWYVLQADPGAQLIYGHHAQNKKQLQRWIEQGKWEQLLRKVPIKAGDFFYVPAGTVHALTKGSLVIETQQSSDVTYRLYDYDRRDAQTGQKRPLQLKKSLDVIQVPFKAPKMKTISFTHEEFQIETLAQPPISAHFYLWHVQINKSWTSSLAGHPYLLVSVIQWQGQLQVAGRQYPIKIGTNFILPNKIGPFKIDGQVELIISAPKSEED